MSLPWAAAVGAMADQQPPPPPSYFNVFPLPCSAWAWVAGAQAAAARATGVQAAGALVAGAQQAAEALAATGAWAQQAARDAGALAAGAATPAGAVAAARLLMAAAGMEPLTDDVQAAENADAIAAAAHAADMGMPLGAAAAHAAGLGMPVGAAFSPPPPPPNSALTTALIAAQAAATEGRAHVWAAALAWERERDAADALAHQIAEAEQLLGVPASPDTGTTPSGSAGPRASHTAVIYIFPSGPQPVGTAHGPSIWPGTVADGPRAARHGGQAVPWAATLARGPTRARPDLPMRHEGGPSPRVI